MASSNLGFNERLVSSAASTTIRCSMVGEAGLTSSVKLSAAGEFGRGVRLASRE